jgi:citrate lyase subunit beta/citryl-CoA lyase
VIVPAAEVGAVDTRQRFHRSYLYVSGSQPRRIERAYESEADAVVIDLEDSVPNAQKSFAREVAASYTAGDTRKPTYVRVNSMRSGRCEDDVRTVAGPGLAGVRLAKTGSPREVETVARLLAEVGSPAVLHLLFESAYGLEVAYQAATSSPAVTMVGIGEYDLSAELGCALDGVMMDACRTRVVMTARGAGLPNPAQSVYPEVHDTDGLLRSSRHGKSLGFAGRMAIHPRQLATIHDVFTPTAAEYALAVEICAAADLAADRDSAVVYAGSGHLVAPPIIAAARQVIEIAEALRVAEEPVARPLVPEIVVEEDLR